MDSSIFYGISDASNGYEFTATITWDDYDNVEGLRPFPADVINEITLSPAPNPGSYITAINTSGNVWTIVWSNLVKDDYRVVLDVENYTKSINSQNSLTFRRRPQYWNPSWMDDQSGECGDSLTWQIDDDGNLTI